MKEHMPQRRQAGHLLIMTMTMSALGGCGGSGSGSTDARNPPPPTTATLARTEIAQTLVQATSDPQLSIAQGKPFVIRAFFAVPAGALRPSRFTATLSNDANPAGTDVTFTCPGNLPAMYPTVLTPGMTGADAAPCTVRIERDSRGAYWAAPGLKINMRAMANDGSAAMAPIPLDLSKNLISKRLVLPLCPRIITDINGDGVPPQNVSDRRELTNAILNYYPFADVQFCPDAFSPLSVTTLGIVGQPGIPTGTQAELGTARNVTVRAIERFRRNRIDGYRQYVHLGLAVAPTSGAISVAYSTGSLTALVYARRNMAESPQGYINYQLNTLHELGHVLGLTHAPGCGAERYDPGFPYAQGIMPANMPDAAVVPVTPTDALPRVPLRGTIGATHGYQMYELSNRLSVSNGGIAYRNQVGAIYDASRKAIVGSGPDEIPVSTVTEATRTRLQVYDLMNYCNRNQYDKWIADYSYFRVTQYSLLRARDDGSFDDLAGKITF